MTTWQSAKHGFRVSGAYFVSTFIFGIMFGITAAASGLEQWLAMLMSLSSFTASGQFAALEFWQSPLPYGTIAISVALVSTRNILLGMAMTYEFDGHSLKRRVVWLFLLNDPGVVTSYRQPEAVDRLGYVTGYGVAMMTSWLTSTLIGLNIASVFASFDLGDVAFAGPLVMATMLMLFARGSKSSPWPWVISGIAALVLFEIGTPNYAILLISVAIGAAAAALQSGRGHG